MSLCTASVRVYNRLTLESRTLNSGSDSGQKSGISLMSRNSSAATDSIDWFAATPLGWDSEIDSFTVGTTASTVSSALV